MRFTHLVFSLLNCTVYVLDEALFPLRLPLCNCSVHVLQSDIVTTVVDFDVAAAVVAAAAGVAPAPAAPGAGAAGDAAAAAAAANVSVGECVTLLEGGVTDKGICKKQVREIERDDRE